MKPQLRVIEGKCEMPSEQETPAEVSKDGYPLPSEMEGRPDAAELRSFMTSFQCIENPKDRRMILDAVQRAAQGET